MAPRATFVHNTFNLGRHMTIEQRRSRLLECDTRVTGTVSEPSLAMRIVSLVGMFLGSDGRVLALSVAHARDVPVRAPFLLPIDPRISSLLDFSTTWTSPNSWFHVRTATNRAASVHSDLSPRSAGPCQRPLTSILRVG
jgi:hypothetical protein